MTLKYQMIVEMYPKLNEMVNGSIPNCEILSLLDTITNKVPTCLVCSDIKRKGKKKQKKTSSTPKKTYLAKVFIKWLPSNSETE